MIRTRMHAEHADVKQAKASGTIDQIASDLVCDVDPSSSQEGSPVLGAHPHSRRLSQSAGFPVADEAGIGGKKRRGSGSVDSECMCLECRGETPRGNWFEAAINLVVAVIGTGVLGTYDECWVGCGPATVHSRSSPEKVARDSVFTLTRATASRLS